MAPLYILAAVFLWSFVPLLVKEALLVFSPGWIAALRLLMGGLILLPASLLARRPAGGGERGVLLLGGLGIAGNYLLYTLAMRHTTASAGTVVVQVEVVFLVVLGVLVLRESLPTLKAAGALLALAGVALVAWNGETLRSLVASRYFLGNVTMLGAGLSWAWYGLAQKLVAPRRPGAAGVAPMLLVGGVACAASAAWQPLLVGRPTPLDWLELGLLGFVCTGLSYLLLARGFSRLEASSAGMLTTTLPVMTMVQAHYWRGEPITLFLALGAAAVIAGVVLIILSGRQDYHGRLAG